MSRRIGAPVSPDEQRLWSRAPVTEPRPADPLPVVPQLLEDDPVDDPVEDPVEDPGPVLDEDDWLLDDVDDPDDLDDRRTDDDHDDGADDDADDADDDRGTGCGPDVSAPVHRLVQQLDVVHGMGHDAPLAHLGRRLRHRLVPARRVPGRYTRRVVVVPQDG